ncbi:MAG: SPOR domain-containing protein [Proteobacteria bacterium]|nr:SPOR domain-containing protein [Burkholderiales bacterium]
MSRDYKKPEPRGRTGTIVLGIFIGLVLGLISALGIAFYLDRAASPFLGRDKPAPVPVPGKGATVTPPLSPVGKTGPEAKPRFDFYTILPGVEQPATDQDLRNRSAEPKTAPLDRFFLQAGAFQNAQDADNLKARLALMGLEATIQTANLGDKGIWHRVRLGPFDDADALGKVRSQLSSNGVDAAPIKVREKAQ